MKKGSKLMKASGVLLLLTLITSCFVGGTFAKYVSMGEGSDTARVAKWGVVVEGKGEAFAKEYPAVDGVGVSVQADVSAVAPGTSGEFKGITLSGRPEVAVDIATTATVELTGDWQDEDGKFYCPLVFNINGVEFNGAEYSSKTEFETNLKNSIEQAASGKVAAGVDLENPGPNDKVPVLLQKYTEENCPQWAGESKIHWEWPFESGNNVADTYLGDIAAGLFEGKEAPNINLQLETSVTQID